MDDAPGAQDAGVHHALGGFGVGSGLNRYGIKAKWSNEINLECLISAKSDLSMPWTERLLKAGSGRQIAALSVSYMPSCSALLIASTISIPRQRTELSSLVRPKRICTARRFLVFL